jgi:photosystem II stability/assembly factor-like uncharacterized protein
MAWKIVDSTGITWYWSIDCINSMECMAIALGTTGPKNKVTTDGGLSWFVTLNDSSIFDNNGNITKFPSGQLVSIAYPDKNLCIAAGDSGYYFRSTDNGSTWIKGRINLTQQAGPFQHVSISMYDTLQGAFKTHYEMLLTKDGGLTWFSPKYNIIDSLLPFSIMDVKVIDKDVVVATAYNNNIVRYLLLTTDFGKTWSCKVDDLFQNRLEKVFCVNRNIMFGACAEQIKPYSPSYRDGILKSTDGGKSWCVKLDTLLHPNGGIKKIIFADDHNGFALTQYRGLWRTTNGGEFWFKDSVFDQEVHHFIVDIAVLSSNDIIAVTDGKYILRSFLSNSFPESADELSFISLYPNPASDYIDINLERWSPSSVWTPSEIQIYNALGQCVLSPLSFGEGSGVRLDISALPTGAYFLVLRDGKEILTNSFIVLR